MRALRRWQPPPGHTHCCAVGFSLAARGDLLCVVLMGFWRTTCSTIGLSGTARSFCSMSGAPPVLVCWPWWLQVLLCSSFFPLLKSALPEVHPALLTAQHWASFGAAGAGSDVTWGSDELYSQRPLPQLLATKSLLHKLATYVFRAWLKEAWRFINSTWFSIILYTFQNCFQNWVTSAINLFISKCFLCLNEGIYY